MPPPPSLLSLFFSLSLSRLLSPRSRVSQFESRDDVSASNVRAWREEIRE